MPPPFFDMRNTPDGADFDTPQADPRQLQMDLSQSMVREQTGAQSAEHRESVDRDRIQQRGRAIESHIRSGATVSLDLLFTGVDVPPQIIQMTRSQVQTQLARAGIDTPQNVENVSVAVVQRILGNPNTVSMITGSQQSLHGIATADEGNFGTRSRQAVGDMQGLAQFFGQAVDTETQTILASMQGLHDTQRLLYLSDPIALALADPRSTSQRSQEDVVAYLMSTAGNVRAIEVALSGTKGSMGSLMDIISGDGPMGGLLMSFLKMLLKMPGIGDLIAAMFGAKSADELLERVGFEPTRKRSLRTLVRFGAVRPEGEAQTPTSADTAILQNKNLGLLSPEAQGSRSKDLDPFFGVLKGYHVCDGFDSPEFWQAVIGRHSLTLKDTKDKDVAIDFSRLEALSESDFNPETLQPADSFFAKLNALSERMAAPAETPIDPAASAIPWGPTAPTGPGTAAESPAILQMRKKAAEEIHKKLFEISSHWKITRDDMKEFMAAVAKQYANLTEDQRKAYKTFTQKVATGMLMNGYTIATAEDAKLLDDMMNGTTHLDFAQLSKKASEYGSNDFILSIGGKKDDGTPDLTKLYTYKTTFPRDYIGSIDGTTSIFTPRANMLSGFTSFAVDTSNLNVFTSQRDLLISSVVVDLGNALEKTIEKEVSAPAAATTQTTTVPTPAPAAAPTATVSVSPAMLYSQRIVSIEAALRGLPVDRKIGKGSDGVTFTHGNPPVTETIEVSYADHRITIGDSSFTVSMNALAGELASVRRVQDTQGQPSIRLMTAAGQSIDTPLWNFMQVMRSLLDPAGSHSYVFHNSTGTTEVARITLENIGSRPA